MLGDSADGGGLLSCLEAARPQGMYGVKGGGGGCLERSGALASNGVERRCRGGSGDLCGEGGSLELKLCMVVHGWKDGRRCLGRNGALPGRGVEVRYGSVAGDLRRHV